MESFKYFRNVLYCFILIHPSSQSDFEALTKTRSLFVDKTMLLDTLFGTLADEKIILTTAPSGFGKSVNLDMIKRFVQLELDERGNRVAKNKTSNFRLFDPKAPQPLKISQCDNIIRYHMAAYPVIHLDLSNVTAPTLKDTVLNLHKVVKRLFQPYDWLENKKIKKISQVRDILAQAKLKDDARCLNKFIRQQINLIDVQNSIRKLAELLYDEFHRKVIVLIDNYDALFMDAVYQDSITSLRELDNFFNEFLSTTLEDPSDHLKLVLITGTHITSIKTTANIVKFPFLVYHDLTEFFGFTSEELTSLLENHPGSATVNELQVHYGGYLANGSSTPVSNPRSVIKYLSLPNKTSIVPESTIDNSQLEVLVKRFMSNNSHKGYWNETSFDLMLSLDIDQLERISDAIKSNRTLTANDYDTCFTILFANGYFAHPNYTSPDVVAFPNKQIMDTFQHYLR